MARFDVPASQPKRLLFGWLTGGTLAVILLFAARARLQWPLIPTSDWDTWGYIYPGLAKLTGHGFAHIQARNFLYPGWVYLLLRTAGDFRAISIVQHLIGLASGGLFWVCWRQWRGWFAGSRLPRWADAVAGLGAVAFFVRSPSVINFEHLIRPEAVFPFFVLIDLSLLMAFARAWFVERRTRRAWWLGGWCVFTATLLYQLKPSFGLAVGVAVAPVLAAVVWPRRGEWRLSAVPGCASLVADSMVEGPSTALVPRSAQDDRKKRAVDEAWPSKNRSKLGLVGAMGVGATVAGLMFLLPEHRLGRADTFGTVFLPETLLTVHAGIIRDQMTEDVRTGAKTPYPAEWLAMTSAFLDHELPLASLPESRPYPTLGFNPDYLLYRDDSFCRWLDKQRSPKEVAGFCVYYYVRAWTHRPGAMLAKVARQLGVFYGGRCSAFWPSDRIKVSWLYHRSVVVFDFPTYQARLAEYGPARAYLADAGKLSESADVLVQPEWTIGLNKVLAVFYLPVMVAFLVGMAVVARWPGEKRRGVWGAGWLLVLVYGLNFANCLTIAVVHSLNVDRYGQNLLVYALFAEVGAVVWLWEMAAAWREKVE